MNKFLQETLALAWTYMILLPTVVDVRTNQPCKYSQSVLRNASLMALSILDAVFIFGKQRRRLGDFLASTKVVRLELTD